MKPPVRIDLSQAVVREVRDESDDYKDVWYLMDFDEYYNGYEEDDWFDFGFWESDWR